MPISPRLQDKLDAPERHTKETKNSRDHTAIVLGFVSIALAGYIGYYSLIIVPKIRSERDKYQKEAVQKEDIVSKLNTANAKKEGYIDSLVTAYSTQIEVYEARNAALEAELDDAHNRFRWMYGYNDSLATRIDSSAKEKFLEIYPQKKQ